MTGDRKDEAQGACDKLESPICIVIMMHMPLAMSVFVFVLFDIVHPGLEARQPATSLARSAVWRFSIHVPGLSRGGALCPTRCHTAIEHQLCWVRPLTDTGLIPSLGHDRVVTIYFVALEQDAKEFYAEALSEYDLVAVPNLREVDEDAEIVCVFLDEQVDDVFLTQHSHLKLVATRSNSVDHIDLAA